MTVQAGGIGVQRFDLVGETCAGEEVERAIDGRWRRLWILLAPGAAQ